MTHVLDEEVEHYIRLLTEGLEKEDDQADPYHDKDQEQNDLDQ